MTIGSYAKIFISIGPMINRLIIPSGTK